MNTIDDFIDFWNEKISEQKKILKTVDEISTCKERTTSSKIHVMTLFLSNLIYLRNKNNNDDDQEVIIEYIEHWESSIRHREDNLKYVGSDVAQIEHIHSKNCLLRIFISQLESISF